MRQWSRRPLTNQHLGRIPIGSLPRLFAKLPASTARQREDPSRAPKPRREMSTRDEQTGEGGCGLWKEVNRKEAPSTEP
jgi:hypothetical protein